MFGGFYSGKTVWVTGHTGFKGGWLTHWLISLGAEVSGFAKAPEGDSSLYSCLNLDQRMRSWIGDIQDPVHVRQVIEACQPETVFHMAAQSLVRRSYRDPIETFNVNVMGTANLLSAVEQSQCECDVLVITSDKCYENSGAAYAFKEEDPLGGHDPYSASKACAEIVTASYRRSFFEAGNSRIASARAGNVIGGGDWAEDRLLPGS